MGAPTNAANVKKVLANPEPSTHGGKADMTFCAAMSAFDPKRTLTSHNAQMFHQPYCDAMRDWWVTAYVKFNSRLDGFFF